MKRQIAAALLVLAVVAALPLAAQDGTGAAPAAPQMTPDMQAMVAAWQKASTPGAPHQQLAEHFAGTWTTKQTMWLDPAAPPMVETGKSVNTPVFGGRQLRIDFTSQFMGQPFEGVGYSGYDNVRGKFTSTWADNMSTGFLMTLGDYDAATRTYTFRGDMADPMKDGAMTPVRETLRIVDADHHVLEMFETHAGKEARTMQIEYARAK